MDIVCNKEKLAELLYLFYIDHLPGINDDLIELRKDDTDPTILWPDLPVEDPLGGEDVDKALFRGVASAILSSLGELSALERVEHFAISLFKISRWCYEPFWDPPKKPEDFWENIPEIDVEEQSGRETFRHIAHHIISQLT